MRNRLLIRLLPLLLGIVVIGAWFADVQADGPYVLRNLLPPLAVLIMAGMVLRANDGVWRPANWRLPLATIGFAIPAIGLSVYLHYAYSVNLDELFSDATRPDELFRFLPVYTTGAGFIGFAIGWIIGRNV